MAKRLLQKQQKFIYHYLNNGGNGRQAIISAGYNVKDNNSADVIAHNNLKNQTIQEKIKLALNKRDITEDKIAGVIEEGLKANVSFFNPSTKQMEESDVPAHLIRHRFMDTVLDITGAKAPKQIQTEVNLRGILAVGDIDKIKQRINL